MATLEALFNSFCSFGSGKADLAEMDNAKFVKLCRDTNLFDKKFTTTDADLMFTKFKKAGERKIDYQIFRKSILPQIAERKGVAVQDLITSMKQAGGPSINSVTKVEAFNLEDSAGSPLGSRSSSTRGAGSTGSSQQLRKGSSSSAKGKKGKRLSGSSAGSSPLGVSYSSITAVDSDDDSDDDGALASPTQRVIVESLAYAEMLSGISGVVGYYKGCLIEIKGMGLYKDYLKAHSAPASVPAPTSPGPASPAPASSQVAAPSAVVAARPVVVEPPTSPQPFRHTGRFSEDASNDRMNDGIAEAYTVAANASMRRKDILPKDYTPSGDVMQFFLALPPAKYPPAMIQQMLADFEKNMGQAISVLEEQKASLTRLDVLAIYGYSYELMASTAPKRSHPHQIYLEMNAAMRAGGPALDPWMPLVYHLAAALKKLGTHEEKLYRGVSIAFPAELYDTGKEVVWDAFSSSTTDIKVAQEFVKSPKPAGTSADTTGTVFVINTKYAHRVYVYSKFPEEKEVLFPPTSRFIVKNRMTPDAKELLGLPYDIIELEQIPPALKK